MSEKYKYKGKFPAVRPTPHPAAAAFLLLPLPPPRARPLKSAITFRMAAAQARIKKILQKDEEVGRVAQGTPVVRVAPPPPTHTHKRAPGRPPRTPFLLRSVLQPVLQ